MDPTTELLLALPAAEDAPTIARDFLVHRVTGLPRELLEDATLLVSEVVGNAIRHGRPEITMRLVRDATGLRITVHDGGEQLPVIADGMPAPTEPGGRGMLIVAAVAHAWGITPSQPPPGKAVWFELRCDDQAGA